MFEFAELVSSRFLAYHQTDWFGAATVSAAWTCASTAPWIEVDDVGVLGLWACVISCPCPEIWCEVPGRPNTSAPMYASCVAFIQKLYWGIAEPMPHECPGSIRITCVVHFVLHHTTMVR